MNLLKCTEYNYIKKYNYKKRELLQQVQGMTLVLKLTALHLKEMSRADRNTQ